MRNAEIADSTKSMTAISSVALRHSAFIIPHSAFKKITIFAANCNNYVHISLSFRIVGGLSFGSHRWFDWLAPTHRFWMGFLAISGDLAHYRSHRDAVYTQVGNQRPQMGLSWYADRHSNVGASRCGGAHVVA